MTFEEMKKIVVDTLNCEEDKVTMEASLTEDLEADSLDAVELNMAWRMPAACPCPTRSWQSSRPWATSTTTSPHTSEAEHHERDPRPVPRPDAGTHVSAESPAGCRGRLA